MLRVPQVGRTRLACSAGSRWHRFAFNEDEDVNTIVRISPLADGLLEIRSASGEVRTTLAVPNYTLVTNGKCGVFTDYVKTQAECLAAATSLGVMWNRNPDEAVDDGKSIGHSDHPRGCYLKTAFGLQELVPTSDLKVNVNDGNTRVCEREKLCICKRAFNISEDASLGESDEIADGELGSGAALPDDMGITNPTHCDSSLCCVVIYERAQGEQCNPVPIWDFTNWVHPGGPFVQASSLCGSVRYDWLSKNGNHGGDARPEDLTANTFAGGATRVGTYVDPACAAEPNATAAPEGGREYRICSVEESVGGLIKLVPHNPYQVLADNQNPCSGGLLCSTCDWYALYNPPINFSTPSADNTQSFDASEVTLSPLAYGNGPSDAYLLESAPPSCRLSEQTSAYMQVGSLWLRLDPRLELMNCTGTCQLQGHFEHPYTLANQSFIGVDNTVSEVANEPVRGSRFNMWLADESGSDSFMPFNHLRDSAKTMAWTAVVLWAPDQLRHRVAFALSQILVVGEEGFGRPEDFECAPWAPNWSLRAPAAPSIWPGLAAAPQCLDRVPVLVMIAGFTRRTMTSS